MKFVYVPQHTRVWTGYQNHQWSFDAAPGVRENQWKDEGEDGNGVSQASQKVQELAKPEEDKELAKPEEDKEFAKPAKLEEDKELAKPEEDHDFAKLTLNQIKNNED